MEAYPPNMAVNITIIILSSILLPVLLHFESTKNRKGLVPIKTLLSLLFVFIALLQPHPHSAYYHVLLTGLLFCLCGDICLTLPHRVFPMGLIAFLLGHVFYVIAFFRLSGLNSWSWSGAVVLFLIGGGVALWLKPYLGRMKWPVLAYIVVISLMVLGAFTILGHGQLSPVARTVIFSGALAFYISDVFVARDRFIRAEGLNRVVGLPLYYGGQFLLAFSVGMV